MAPSYDDYLKILQQPPKATGDVPQDLIDAVTGVESSGNPNAVSPQGARGSMQVTKPAWIDYGTPGLPFEDATDAELRQAAIAKLNDDYRHYGGNREKTIAAYIGGRGAVLPDGTIRDDVADAHGTTPAAYTQRVVGRLGTAQPVAAKADKPDEFLQYMDRYLNESPAAPAAKSNDGVLQDVTQGLKRSAMVEMPDWIGRSMQWFGATETGAKFREFAKEHEPLYQESETGKKNSQWWNPRGNVFEAASQVIPSQAVPAAFAAGGLALGGPPGALIGYGIGSIAQLPIFYGSAAQQSYEAVYDNLIKQGNSPEQADIIAKRTARLEGASEVGTEFAGDAFALLAGSKVTPTGQAAGATVKSLLRPTVKSFLTTAAKVTGAEVSEEVLNAIAQPEIRKQIGQTGEGATWDQTLSVILPTAMSMAPTGIGVGANLQAKKAQMVTALEDPATPVEARAYVAQIATKLIEDESPEVAKAFALYSGEQIQKGAPVQIGDDDLYLNYAEQRKQETSQGTTIDAINQKRAEYLQGQMEQIRKEAGVDPINGDIYATPLGEQYQWLESELAKTLNRSMASDTPTPAPAEEPTTTEPDIEEPMRPFAERAMYAYPSRERAQSRADAMSKVQNGQYVVTEHPRLPGKFAVVPTEWVNLPPVQPTAPEITQDEVSQRLQQAASQAPVPAGLEAQMLQAGADRALAAIESRGGVASPVEAQIIEQADLGRPYDRIDPSLVPSAADGEIANQRLEAAVQEAAPPQESPAGANEQTIRKQVGTPEFKAWFEGSKVVDELGEPLVVYHGSPDRFGEGKNTTVRGRENGYRPFFTTPSQELAESYARGGSVSPLFIRANPIDLTGNSPVVAELLDIYNNDPRIIDFDAQWNEEEDGPFDGNEFLLANSPNVVDRVREMGFDAMKFEEHPGVFSYATFSPTQVKSAVSNRGTFDPKSPSISDSRAPVGSSLPFGAGFQVHRLANVTTGNAPLPAVSERASLGSELSRYPAAFTKASGTMQAAINDAVSDLVSAGMPETWLWGVRNIGTHSAIFGKGVRGRFSTHYTGTGREIRGLSLQRSLLERAGKDETVPYQVRGVLAHELAHGIDQVGSTYLSHSSPLFDVEVSETGELLPTGPVMREAMTAFLNDFDTQGPLADLLHYPLASFKEAVKNPDGINSYKSETFAQLSSLYYLNPSLMQEKLPTAFALFEEIKRATEELGTAAAGTSGIGSESSRRERSLAQAVQGAFRTLSESSGGAVFRGVRNGRNDARVDQDRTGEPGTGAREDTGRTERHRGELLGSDFGSDVGHRRTKKDGTYVGAPKTVTSPQTLAVMRKRIEQLAKEGEEGKFWYERSGKAILDLAEGNKDLAEKIVGLFAIYSPSTQVASNTTLALKAYYEWADGKPITTINKGGAVTAEHAQRWMDGTASEKEVEGVKRSNFYRNLMREIDPERLGADAQGVTVDMWMARALGFLKPKVSTPGKKVKSGSGSEYGFAEREIRRVAERLGWEPQQAQAAIWVAIKSRFDNIYGGVHAQAIEAGWLVKHEGTNRYGKKTIRYTPANVEAEESFERALLTAAMDQPAQDVTDAAYDFADGVAARTAQISWEAKPGETTGILPGIFKAPLEQQIEYLDAVDRALRDENGQDEIAKMVGLGGSHTIFGPSAWKLDVGQGAQTEAAIATDRPTHETVSIHEPARDVFNLYAAIRGYVLDQEAVAWHYPIYQTSLKQANGIGIQTAVPMDHAQVKALYEEISRRAEHTEFAPIYTANGFRVLNFSELENPQFHKLIEDAYHAVEGLPDADFTPFRSEGDYISNDYQEHPNGQGYMERIAGTGRSDLQGRADDLKRRVVEVNRDFSRRYGWGAASLEERDIAGSSEEGGISGRMGQGDVLGVRGPRVSIRPQQADGQEVTGIHYGKQPNLSALHGGMYGSGIKGAERNRLAYDPSLAPRVYFYLDKDTNVLPRPEPGLGPNVYRTTLTNMYPFKTDPAGILPAIRDIMDPNEKGNELERRVIAAGYDGYVNSGLGMAVVLGRVSVPVQFMGKHNGRGGIADIAGSNLAVPAGTSDETMQDLVRNQMALANVKGDEKLFPLGHARRVALYATDLGRAAGLTDSELSALSTAAMLHDIGKVTLPEPVLNKPGALTRDERHLVEQHAVAAEKLLADQLGVVREAALQHHERWDGQGYPNGLAGEQISKFARILAVADVFDALTEERPYHKSITKDEALKQLREWSGSHFDPELVDRFAGIAGSNNQAPLWYSELSRSIEGIKQPTAPVGQWLAIIDNLQTKGVKGDEIEWSGVKEWLQMQAGKVTKDQILQYLQQNGVQIEEVVKGEATLRERMDWLREQGRTTEEVAAMPDWRVEAETADLGAKYQQYVLPGGENYRELLLTLPEVRDPEYEALRKEYMDLVTNGFNAQRNLSAEETARMNEIRSKMQGMRKFQQGDQGFRSTHFDEPNILAHVRFDERTDADGKRVLFIEEIQSDWGQKGKREGFASGFTVELTDGTPVPWQGKFNFATKEEAQKVVDYVAGFPAFRAAKIVPTKGTPVAPFVSKTGQWVSLAMKRMIRWAADNGFDRIAWTTGEQQAARYDLSKQISEIEYRVKEGADSGKLEAFDKSGERVISREVPTGDLPDVIGKEAAERLMKSKGPGYMGSTDRAYVLSGEELKVGGEGMKDFYDKIVPNAANVLLKKLGGERVTKTKIDTAQPHERMKLARQRSGMTDNQWNNLRSSEQKELIEKLTEGTTDQHSFDITDAMRETALQGMPLFAGSNNQMPEWLASLPQADQDAAKKAGIYIPRQTWQQRLQGLRNGWKERVTQGMFDQFAPVKDLDERAYILDRMTKGADAGLEAILMYGKPVLNSAGALDVKDLNQGGAIQLLSELGGEHDRFLGWIAGNRAYALKQVGRENNLTDVDISALRNWNQGNLPDGRNRAAVYADVHRRFNQFNKAVLDVAEKAGLIDGKERKNWEEDFYVPFYRILEDQGYEGPRDVGSLVNQYAFKRLRGGKEQLNDLFSNVLRNWNHLIAASLKNQAAQATLEVAAGAGVATEVQGREKGAVYFRDGGKQRWFVVEDPLLLSAITSLEHAGISGGPVMKALQKAKSYLTFGVTLAPAFKVRNLVRDQVSAIAMNPISGNLAGNFAQGWKLTAKDSAQYAHMLAGGGLMRFGTQIEGNRSAHTERLVKMASAQTTVTTAEKARNLLEKAWDAYQELGDRSENVTRATVYRQAYDQAIRAGKGQDEAHLLASYAARDSMDFGLQGAYPAIRLLSQLVPFFNARLQGLYKIGREGVAPTIRMLTGNAKIGDAAKAARFNAMAAAVSMASIALMLAQGDDDDWKAREDWDRDTYWWIKVGGTAWRIPKPFELGAIGSLAERGVEAMMNGLGPDDRRLFVQRLGWLVANALSMNPTPQAVKPLIDLYANTNSFTGRPIETAGMEKLSKSERIGPSTSTLSQILGKATGPLGVSPVQIDSLINGYFSWLGSNILWVSDFVLRPMAGAPEKPTWRMEDYPVLGSFARELPAPQSRYVTLFYENAARFGELASDIRHYQQLGLTEKAMELYAERKDEVALAKIYSHVQRKLGEINAQIKRVQVSDLPGDQKREQIDRLNARKIELAKLVEERRKSAQNPGKNGE